jgi:uncharacterized membrane protein
MREVWLYIHLLGVIVWIGGGALFALWGARARRTGQPSLAIFVAETITWLMDRVIIPALLVTLASGVLLAFATDAARTPPRWLIVKLALVVVGVVLVLAGQRPTARALVHALHATGKKAGAQVPGLARRQARLGMIGGLLGLIIIALAVFKP